MNGLLVISYKKPLIHSDPMYWGINPDDISWIPLQWIDVRSTRAAKLQYIDTILGKNPPNKLVNEYEKIYVSSADPFITAKLIVAYEKAIKVPFYKKGKFVCWH